MNPPTRTVLLVLACVGTGAAAVGVFGASLASIGVPAALLLVLLADGMARPASSLLYPTISHGPRHGHRVALSFDDGPDPEVTPQILDVLAQYGARATFFTIGRALRAQPLLAQRMVAEHHELGNHSWAHSRWQNFFGTRRLLREIERGAESIAGIVPQAGQPLYRPPMGLKSPPLAVAAQSLQLTLVAWSLHSYDSRGNDPRRIAQRVLDRIRPGDIVLMHDGHDLPGRHRRAIVLALPQILRGLRDRGLRSVTVSELLNGEPAA